MCGYAGIIQYRSAGEGVLVAQQNGGRLLGRGEQRRTMLPRHEMANGRLSQQDGRLQRVHELGPRTDRRLVTHDRIETAHIVGRVVDDALRAVRLERAVLAPDTIAVAHLLLALDVARKLIPHGVPVAVVIPIVVGRLATILMLLLLLLLILSAAGVALLVVQIVVVAGLAGTVVIRAELVQSILRAAASQLLAVLLRIHAHVHQQ